MSDSRGEYNGLKQEYDKLEKEYNSTTEIVSQSDNELGSLREKLQNTEDRTKSLENELKGSKEEYNELKQQSALSPPQIQYENVSLGDCKYELTDKQAKEEGFDIPHKYNKMFIYEDYVLLCEQKSASLNPVKIYSRKKIDKPLNFDELRLKVNLDSKLITQDEGLFKFISELEK